MSHNKTRISNILKNLLLSATFLASVTYFGYPLHQPTFAIAQDAIETEREKKFEEMLLLNIPAETDNPNYAIVFTDPSGKGIFIAIDGASERQVSSPYLLPTLAVGSHKITIRFTDKEETPQTLEKRIVIIPRAPVIKIPQTTTKDTIEINGTAMPNSTVRIFMAGPSATYKTEVTSDSEGIWGYIFKEEFSEGIYTVTAITTKNGFASLFGEETIFKISTSKSGVIELDEVEKPISFSFDSLLKSDPVELFNSNRELIYLVGGTLLAGLLLGVILSKIGSGRGSKKAEDQFLRLLREKTTSGIGKSMDKLNTDSENKVLGKLSKKQETKEDKVETIEVETAEEEVKVEESDVVDEEIKAVEEEATDTVQEDKETLVLEETETEDIVDTDVLIDEDAEDGKDTETSENVDEKTESKNEVVAKPTFLGGLLAKLRPKQVVVVEPLEDEPAKSDENAGDNAGILDKTPQEDSTPEPTVESADETKEITKEEFLAKFKDFDPDDETGKVIEKHDESAEATDIEQTRKSFEQTPVKKPKTTKDRNLKITLTGSLK